MVTVSGITIHSLIILAGFDALFLSAAHNDLLELEMIIEVSFSTEEMVLVLFCPVSSVVVEP